jgi:hypothetical protein
MAILAAGTRLCHMCACVGGALIKCRPAVITNVSSKSYDDGGWWKLSDGIFLGLRPTYTQRDVPELSTEKEQLLRSST